MSSFSLDQLESHIGDKSYIDGYTPSQADVQAFSALTEAPSADKYPHAARWYRHIQSYTNEHSSLPGDKSRDAGYWASAASASTSSAKPAAAAADDDDDIDLFGSDDEEVDEEAEKLKQQRLAEYAAKKANKPKTIAKSVVTLDVKPWDDETDMEALEKEVRSIEQDGLVWGSSKLVAIGYGIRKLQITLVVEDEKVSLDELQDKIAEFEDYVQSSDVQAMQSTYRIADRRSLIFAQSSRFAVASSVHRIARACVSLSSVAVPCHPSSQDCCCDWADLELAAETWTVDLQSSDERA